MTESSRFWNGIVTGDATEAPYNADTEFANHTKRSIGATRADAGVVLGTGSEATQLEALQVTENSPAGMSVLLNIGSALVNGSQYDNDAALTIAVAANASGNPRIDTIVLRKSWAAQEVRAAILQGTPAASPVPPTLTQNPGTTYEIPLADIAVANAAVSITGTNITSRAIASIPFDGVYLDRMLNNSGAVRQTGDVVVNDTSANRAFTTTTLVNNPNVLGVIVGRIAASGFGRVLSRGIGYFRANGAITRGDYLYTSTGAGVGTSSSTQKLFNTFAQALETSTGAGNVLAFIDAGIPPNIGKLIINGGSSGSSLNVDTLPQFYPEYMIAITGLSQIAATSETLNIQFGSAGGGCAARYHRRELLFLRGVHFQLRRRRCCCSKLGRNRRMANLHTGRNRHQPRLFTRDAYQRRQQCCNHKSDDGDSVLQECQYERQPFRDYVWRFVEWRGGYEGTRANQYHDSRGQ